MTTPLMAIQTNGWISSVAFSHDGVHIVSGSSDKSVQVWDAATGAELQQLNGHTDHVNSVAFSHDGIHIVSGSSDESVRVWDTSTGAALKQLNGHTNCVRSVAFHMMTSSLSLAQMMSLCECGKPQQVPSCSS